MQVKVFHFLILLLYFYTETKRNYMDKTENKNISESNDAATQPLTQEEEKTKHVSKYTRVISSTGRKKQEQLR